jgi:hypothetical protein
MMMIMIRSFISVNKEIDIDVKSGEFVINSGVEKIVRFFSLIRS